MLKAQVEFSKLIEQQTVSEQRKQIAEARLNSLLYREPESPLGTPEELKPPISHIRWLSSMKPRSQIIRS